MHKFITQFLEIGQNKREGYHPKNITPYLHVLLYHIPFFISRYGTLANFSGQGAEKTNDIIKQIHQTKTNKHDATKDALLVRKRMEIGHLSKISRNKRRYNKRDSNYWTVQTAEMNKNKKRKIQDELKQAEVDYRGVQDNQDSSGKSFNE